MANLTADQPGTKVDCPTCGETVDPYFHCCVFAHNDEPYRHRRAVEVSGEAIREANLRRRRIGFTDRVTEVREDGEDTGGFRTIEVDRGQLATSLNMRCHACGGMERVLIVQLGNPGD